MKLIKNIGNFIAKNERVLLTVVTIGAEAVAIWQGIKQGPKFKEIMDKVKAEEITKGQAAKEMIIPTAKIAVPFALSSSAAILNHKKASDTIASLTNLYLTTKTIKDEYQAQAEKEMDPETAKKVEQEAYSAYRGVSHQKVYYTGYGEDKFVDRFANVEFYSSATFIAKTVNDFNEELNNAREDYHHQVITASEFYDALNVPVPREVYENYIWDHDTGLIRYHIDPFIDECGKPCGMIIFDTKPQNVSLGDDD